MKHFFKLTCVAAVLTACIFTLPFLKKETDRDNKLSSKTHTTNQFNIALNSQLRSH